MKITMIANRIDKGWVSRFSLVVLFLLSSLAAAAQTPTCRDEDLITDLEKVSELKTGTASQQSEAARLIDKIKKNFKTCEIYRDGELEKELNVILAKLRKDSGAGYSRAEALSALNGVLSSTVGTFRTPFANMNSFYYLSASATLSGTQLEIITRRATSMGPVRPFECENYGFITTTQTFDLRDVTEFRDEQRTNTESSSILTVKLRDKVGRLSTVGWGYTRIDRRTGECFGRKENDVGSGSIAEVGIAYPRGERLYHTEENYRRLYGIMLRLVELAKE